MGGGDRKRGQEKEDIERGGDKGKGGRRRGEMLLMAQFFLPP